jgi:hypothetical protein
MHTRSSVPASTATYRTVSPASVCAAPPRWWCLRPCHRPGACARWRRALGGRAAGDPSGGAATAAGELSPMTTSGKATPPRFKRSSPRKKQQLCSRHLTVYVSLPLPPLICLMKCLWMRYVMVHSVCGWLRWWCYSCAWS